MNNHLYSSVLVIIFAITVSACSEIPDKGTKPYNTYNNNLQVAEVALQGNDYDQAINIYRGLVQKYPDQVEPAIGLGNALLQAGAIDEALSRFSDSAKQFPNNPLPQIGLGKVFLRKHQASDAEEHFSLALTIDPANSVARNGFAVSYDFQGKHIGAEEIYRAMLEEHPDDMVAKNNLGLNLILQKRYQEAISLLTAAQDSPTATPQIRDNLALAYGLSGDITTAGKINRLSLSPTDTDQNEKFYKLHSTSQAPQ